MPALIDYAIIGAAGYGVAYMIDRAMDYGHIFGFIRYQIARTSQELVWLGPDDGQKECCDLMTVGEMIEATRHNTNFAQRLEDMDDLYWRTTITRPWFVIFLCRDCMTAYTTTALAAAYIFTQGAFETASLVGYFTSMGIAYLTVSKGP